MGGQAERHRVRATHPRAGETEPEPDAGRQSRQEVGGSDVRDEPDCGLGHCDHGLFTDHAHLTVHTDAEPATHGGTVDQRDIRLGVFGDQLVQFVFCAEIPCHRSVVAGNGGVPDRTDVATCAECPVAGRGDQHEFDGRIVSPRREDGEHVVHHRLVQGIERLGAIKDDLTDPT